MLPSVFVVFVLNQKHVKSLDMLEVGLVKHVNEICFILMLMI